MRIGEKSILMTYLRFNVNTPMKNPGQLVITKSGKKGRTYDSKELINGKVPVYLELSEHEYSDKAILCDPKTLKNRGFID
jgi:hypothetical protein